MRDKDEDDDSDEALEISPEDLEEAEAELEDEADDAESKSLGAFREADYVDRIAGWEFKTRLLYIGDDNVDVEAYYRRPLGSDPGTKWQRIGHSRGPEALDLRRLVWCAERRDKRARQARERREIIESVFGTGTLPIVESLLASRDPKESAAAPLTPRQEAFCRHYLTEPSGTRAAIMAGYAESGANVQAHRLLTNANVLQKISALRRAHALSYALDRDTMLDKLESFIEDAMKGQSYSAALRALLAQAELSGLFNRRHKATVGAEARAAETAGTAADVGK